MEPRNEIAMELRLLSEMLGQMDRMAPYRVPDGYFDELPARVLNRLAAGSTIPEVSIYSASFSVPAGPPATPVSKGSGIPFPAGSPTFQVPEGYFDGFAAQVLSRVKAGASGGTYQQSVSEELAMLSAVVAGISRETPYRLPEGYFGELSPILTVIRETPAYRIPEEYFEEMSPVLSVAGERPTYRVPDGYFERLPAAVAAKLGQAAPAEAILAAEAVQPAASVIPMEREDVRREGDARVLNGSWWKYSSVAAIAACFLLIFSWPQPQINQPVKKAGTPDIVQGLQKLSDQELQAYLEDQHSFITDPTASSTATLDMNEGEVKSLLSEVSDGDLQQYIDEHGKGEDLATN